MVITLRPHQEAFKKRFFESDQHGMVAVHPTGSGKTILSIAIAEEYLLRNPANTVIAIVPKSLIKNFDKEITKLGGVRDITKYRFFTTDGFYYGYTKNELVIDDPDEDEDVEDDDLDKTDIVRKGVFIDRLDLHGMENDPVIVNGAFSTKNSLMIVDEGHNLRTLINVAKKKGKKSMAFILAASEADKVLITTATPLVNYPTDIANLVSMCTYDNKGAYYTKKEFENILNDRTRAMKLLGGKFDFHELTEADMKEYPTSSYENVYMKMPDALYAHYKAQEQYLAKVKEEDIENDFFNGDLSCFYTGVRQASNLTPEELEGTLVKSTWIKDFVKGFIVEYDDNGVTKTKLSHKFIISSQYIPYGIMLILEALTSIGVECGLVIGTATEKQRDEAVKRYNEGSIQVLLISKSGREGLDTKGTDYVIIFENGWNVSTEDQIAGRAIRRGSHADFERKHVTVLRLLMVKPNEYEYGSDEIVKLAGKYNHVNELKSIDLLLMSLSHKKTALITNTFNKIKAYNTEVSTSLEFVQGQAKTMAEILNKYIITEYKHAPFIRNRNQTEGLQNEIMFMGESTRMMLQIPLITFPTDLCSVQFPSDPSNQAAYTFFGKWINGLYTVYLNINMGKRSDMYFDDMTNILTEIVYNKQPMDNKNVIVVSTLKILETTYKKIGAHIKDKDNRTIFIKSIAKLGIAIKNNKPLLVSALVNTFKVDLNVSYTLGWWKSSVVNGVVHITANPEPNQLAIKTFHLLIDDNNLVRFDLNSNENIYNVLDVVTKLKGIVPFLLVNGKPVFFETMSSSIPFDAIFTLK